MFNLLQVLTDEQKEKIKNYIEVTELANMENFIGVDEWLKHWSVEKIKLYKLLGNSLVYKVPFTYNKDKKIISSELDELLDYSVFALNMRKFANKVQNNENHKYGSDAYELVDYIYNILRFYTFSDDLVSDTLRYKQNPDAKLLQLQKGIKPMRALSKIINYFKDDEFMSTYVIPHYEKFRLKHSQIFNEKVVKGNMVISIDPIDFMTMSDNGLNWHSCMSWKQHGCYHVGTIEMMNSNNVVCCYIEADEPYYFNDKYEDAVHSCPNKKYRQLCYVTKDIIVSGKSYPYHVDELSKVVIETVKDLAAKNLGWEYQFGPEEYKDMKYISTTFSMGRARDYIHYKDMNKHNIIFDTRGMYNDMLNDHCTKYFCYRNKVKHNKIINISGKTSCLCCGKPTIVGDFDGRDQWDSWNDIEYNERFHNVGETICEECQDEFRCDCCDVSTPHRKMITFFGEEGKELHYCSRCMDNYIKKCPCCGKPMIITKRDALPTYGIGKAVSKEEYLESVLDFAWGYEKRIYCHTECEKELGEYTVEDYRTRWGRRFTVKLFPYVEEGFYDKFYRENLESVKEIADGEVISEANQ